MAHGLGGTRKMRLYEYAEKSVCKKYDCGHFEIYCNELFEQVIADYISFYNDSIA